MNSEQGSWRRVLAATLEEAVAAASAVAMHHPPGPARTRAYVRAFERARGLVPTVPAKEGGEDE